MKKKIPLHKQLKIPEAFIQPGQIQARGSLCVRVRPLSMLQQPLPHVAPGDGKMLFTALNLYFLRFNFNSKKMCLSAKSECHYT